ncbi:MAG: iron ABC transporter permease [Bacteroidales bacterium]|nr:iron ABC transporter permease [Bacteroidales bacterium]MBO7269219.1 iron ABC transporter permease [Bacteroidales bacterium]
MKKYSKAYYILAAAFVLLFIGNLVYGAVKIPVDQVLGILLGNGSEKESWNMIVLNSRLPQCITALLAGAGLAISGLLLQTLFRNPLAGPSILGISDGANLGVAVIMLYAGGFTGTITGGTYFSMIMAALAGSMAVLALIIYFSRKVRSNVMLLIIGIMIGYLASSVISILNYHAAADKVHQYVMWGMGDFTGVSVEKLPYFAFFTIAGLVYSLLLIKPLNALLLGEMYAANLGIKIKSARISILLCTGILTAAITAFCGPVSFIGLAVPHVARMLLGTSNHKHLVPVTILSGACIALLCNMLTVIPGSNSLLPLNAVTPIIGAPIIIYVIINRKNLQYFN